MATTGAGERQSGSHPGAGPSPEEAMRLYETMLLIRRTEERLRDDAAAGKLPGAVHLYLGEEAVAAGVCAHLPITIIATIGGGSSNAAQHSDTNYPALMNLGGLYVAVPATPADAKGLVKTAIRNPNPCFILEPNGRGGESGDVPDGEYLVPFGKAAVRREGNAVTVVAIGRMLKPALAAAAALAEEGISVEVIDPRTLVPLDYDTILASVAKTGRLAVVDEARESCSAASQISAVVAEQGFGLLKGPIRRLCTPNVAMPYAPNAEAHVIPNETRIAAAVRELAAGANVPA